MSTVDIVAKLWNLCNVLRDDGVTYHQYVTELTYLLFLKMAQETEQEHLLPEGYRWTDLKEQSEPQRLEDYKKLLIHLGSHGSSITRRIYSNAASVIRKPVTLTKLLTEINQLDWYDAKAEGLGDLYEGLLQKNADEKKSGAGQYFTPRVLIDAMVALMRPTLQDVICDPAAGTGGFLISANHYLENHYDLNQLSEKDYDRYQHQTFYGMELVEDTHRLALMNLMLHNLAVDEKGAGILFGDTLSNEGRDLKPASLVLSNPPFGTKQGGGAPTRDDLLHYTSNKQLAFLHVIYHKLLNAGGRAAVILPDNVLFEAGIGQTIRRDLMEKCNLHTILRLPTGIFYAQGVKTNVLFFTKPSDPKQDTGNTKNVWVYDMRANMPQFGKRTVLTEAHFNEFIECFGADAYGNAARTAQDENGRWRCFSREWIRDTKGDSLDISWLKDDSSVDAASLPEPEALASEALAELEAAMSGLQDLLKALGAEQAA
ncbi:N-6 DNA methylase [Thiolinea disciformis]|uniref:class I SAM-dependent DNA methyltransferase n=1 Tax=Thiolinea disciformis TaxID=125614 RepID=UPI00036461E3|nr:N-6 DNA methylase [Thiolinea disciformis]